MCAPARVFPGLWTRGTDAPSPRRVRHDDPVAWYSVRCLLRTDGAEGLFEERITLWEADSFKSAVQRAEHDAQEYATSLGMRYLGLAQAYELPDDPADGAEVFSLMRKSELADDAYLTAFFDTGAERHRDM